MTKRKTRNSQDSQSLWGKLSSSWFRVKSWYFTFHRIISFAAKKKKKEIKKKRKKERKKIFRSKVWEHVKSNSLWFTGILSDNRSNGNVLWTTGPTRDYWRKQNGQLYSIKEKSCLKVGQPVAICGETKVEVTEEIPFSRHLLSRFINFGETNENN